MDVRMRSTPVSIMPFSLCFRITSMMNSRLPEFEMNDVSTAAQRARIDTADSTMSLSSGNRLIDRIVASGVEHSISTGTHASCVATIDSSFSPFSWMGSSSKKRSTACSQMAMPPRSMIRLAFFTSADR